MTDLLWNIRQWIIHHSPDKALIVFDWDMIWFNRNAYWRWKDDIGKQLKQRGYLWVRPIYDHDHHIVKRGHWAREKQP